MPSDAARSDVDRLRVDDAAWDDLVRSDPSGSYLQLAGWARVKAANGWRSRRVVVDAGAGPVGVQLLIRRLGPTPFGVGYAPRGPVGASDAGSIQALTAALARVARSERLSHVTMDPGWGEPVPDDAPRSLGPDDTSGTAAPDAGFTPAADRAALSWLATHRRPAA